MAEIAYQNKDITTKYFGENLKEKSFAIVDYESEYREENKLKYLNYLNRTIKHFLKKNLNISKL